MLLPHFQPNKRQLDWRQLVAICGRLYGHSLPQRYRDFLRTHVSPSSSAHSLAPASVEDTRNFLIAS